MVAFCLTITTPFGNRSALASLAPAFQQDSEFQTWKLRNGDSLVAKVVGQDGVDYLFEKKDGEQVRIRIFDIEPSSRGAVLQAAMAIRIGEQRSGLGGGLGGDLGRSMLDGLGADLAPKKRPNSKGEPLDPEKFKLVEMDFSGSRVFTGTPKGWDLQPKTSQSEFEWEKEVLFRKTINASHMQGVLFDPRVPGRGFQTSTKLSEGITEGFMFDGETNKTLGPFTQQGKSVFDKPEFIAYDGIKHRVATAKKWDGKFYIHIWKTGRDGLQHEFCFNAYPENTRIPFMPSHALFLGEDHLLIVAQSSVVVYDLKNLRVIRAHQFDNVSRPVISPRGDYLFGAAGGKLMAVDLSNLKLVAASHVIFSNKKGGVSHLSGYGIDPKFQRIAIVGRGKLHIVDLKTGEQLQEVFLPSVIAQGCEFINDDFVIMLSAKSSTMVSLPLRSPIWRYDWATPTLGVRQGQVWFSQKFGTDGSLPAVATMLDLPTERELNFTNELKLEDLILLQPGDSLSVDLREAAGSDREIMQKLESNGFKIVRDSRYRLVANKSAHTGETVEFQDVTGGASQSYTKRSESYELALFEGDEKVWYVRGGTSTQDLGNFVVLEAGETVQSKATKGMGTASGFFKNVELPKEFIRIPENGVYGRSKLTEGGFVEY